MPKVILGTLCQFHFSCLQASQVVHLPGSIRTWYQSGKDHNLSSFVSVTELYVSIVVSTLIFLVAGDQNDGGGIGALFPVCFLARIYVT